MKAINKRTLILTSIVILLPMFVGLALWSRLPEQMPTHFGFNGTADGYSNRLFAVVGLPLFLLAIHLLCTFVMRADPKKQNISEKLVQLSLWIAPAVSLFVGVSMYLSALGYVLNINRFVSVFVGLLFVIMGNYLPKCRPNYTMGIRLPWTLADEENWNRTHRFAGYVWIVVGLVVLASAFFGGINNVLTVLLIAAAASPIVYSYIYAKKHGKI